MSEFTDKVKSNFLSSLPASLTVAQVESEKARWNGIVDQIMADIGSSGSSASDYLGLDSRALELAKQRSADSAATLEAIRSSRASVVNNLCAFGSGPETDRILSVYDARVKDSESMATINTNYISRLEYKNSLLSMFSGESQISLEILDSLKF